MVRIEPSRHDSVSQTIDGQAIELRTEGARFVHFATATRGRRSSI